MLLGTHSTSLSSLCPVHTHGPFFISLCPGHTQRAILLLVNCSSFVHRSVAGLLPLFRRLFHQSVTGLLSCSLSLMVSSQLKPFVFCNAIQSLCLVHPVIPGGNPCLFFSFKRTSLPTVLPSLHHRLQAGILLVPTLVATMSVFFFCGTRYNCAVLLP